MPYGEPGTPDEAAPRGPGFAAPGGAPGTYHPEES